MKLKSRYRWTNSMTKGLNHNLQNWLFGRWQRIIKNPRSFCRINNIKMFSYKALFCYWHPFSSLEVCLVRGSKKKLEATAFWNTYRQFSLLVVGAEAVGAPDNPVLDVGRQLAGAHTEKLRQLRSWSRIFWISLRSFLL